MSAHDPLNARPSLRNARRRGTLALLAARRPDVSRHLRAVRFGSPINKGEEMTTSVEPEAHPLDLAREKWDALLNRYIHIEAAARYALAATTWEDAQAALREALKGDQRSSDIVPILDGDLNPL